MFLSRIWACTECFLHWPQWPERLVLLSVAARQRCVCVCVSLIVLHVYVQHAWNWCVCCDHPPHVSCAQLKFSYSLFHSGTGRDDQLCVCQSGGGESGSRLLPACQRERLHMFSQEEFALSYYSICTWRLCHGVAHSPTLLSFVLTGTVCRSDAGVGRPAPASGMEECSPTLQTQSGLGILSIIVHS